MTPKKDISNEELAIAETPKFRSVIAAEAQVDQTLRATREIETAERELLANAAAARTRLEELESIFPQILALRALSRIPEEGLDEVRSEMATCRRKIEESPLALPVFKELRGGEGCKAARKIIEELEMYRQAKMMMLRETRSGTRVFRRGKRLLGQLAQRLGDDAEEDLGRFMEGLKKVRPASFWGLS